MTADYSRCRDRHQQREKKCLRHLRSAVDEREEDIHFVDHRGDDPNIALQPTIDAHTAGQEPPVLAISTSQLKEVSKFTVSPFSCCL